MCTCSPLVILQLALPMASPYFMMRSPFIIFCRANLCPLLIDSKSTTFPNISPPLQSLKAVATLSFRDTDDNLLMTSDVLEAGGARLTTDSNGRPAVSLAVKDKDTFYKLV